MPSLLKKINNKKIAFWLPASIFLLVLLLPGCLDVIEIEVPESDRERLTIQGRLIIGDPATVQVKISKLFDFTAIGKRPVNAQSVKLFDEDDNFVELDDNGLGNYSLTIPADYPGFKIALGKGYWIEVKTFDGRVMESAIEKGFPVPEPDGLNFRMIEKPVLDLTGKLSPKEFIQFVVSTPLQTADPRPQLHLGWEAQWTFKVLDSPYHPLVEQKTCYITQELGINSLKIFDPGSSVDPYLKDYSIYETEVTRNFAEGLYFTVIQESLSETAYTYFDQVAKNTDRTGSMFESPPGAVISNFRNIGDDSDQVFGFFYVTQQDTIRKYVRPADVGSPPFYCPPPGGIFTQSGDCADFICCDCLSVKNSTTKIPGFWEE